MDIEFSRGEYHGDGGMGTLDEGFRERGRGEKQKAMKNLKLTTDNEWDG
jgi:hypothetical protein